MRRRGTRGGRPAGPPLFDRPRGGPARAHPDPDTSRQSPTAHHTLPHATPPHAPPCSSSLQYKYIIRAPDSGEVIEWQAGDNLTIELPPAADGPVVVKDAWEGDGRELIVGAAAAAPAPAVEAPAPEPVKPVAAAEPATPKAEPVAAVAEAEPAPTRPSGGKTPIVAAAAAEEEPAPPAPTPKVRGAGGDGPAVVMAGGLAASRALPARPASPSDRYTPWWPHKPQQTLPLCCPLPTCARIPAACGWPQAPHHRHQGPQGRPPLFWLGLNAACIGASSPAGECWSAQQEGTREVIGRAARPAQPGSAGLPANGYNSRARLLPTCARAYVMPSGGAGKAACRHTPKSTAVWQGAGRCPVQRSALLPTPPYALPKRGRPLPPAVDQVVCVSCATQAVNCQTSQTKQRGPRGPGGWAL